MFVRSVSLIALAAALAGPVAAAAQTAPAPAPAPNSSTAPESGGRHHHHHRDPFWRALRTVNLSDAQKQQVAAFHAQEQSANNGADAATKKANAEKMKQQVMGILTPDQQSQMTAAMQKHRAMPGAAPMPGSAASPAPSH